jgi:8-oxo-dGTP pyrophosphatase MutT (NUDIX family)
MQFCISRLEISEISRKLNLVIQKTPAVTYQELPNDWDFFVENPRHAAVLMPLLFSEGSWHLLFTRRNSELPEHSGQVAFPGGRSEPEDLMPETTALREAKEEIGLNSSDVQILGRLHPYLTVTNYLVTPVVGIMPWPYPLVLAQDEVSRVFTIPLEWLAHSANYEERLRKIPNHNDIPVIYYHPYQGEILWGASARFTLEFIKALSM